MTVATLSGHEFNQDTSRATKAALNGPVVITERGRPDSRLAVLLTMQEYQHLIGGQMTLIEALAQPDAAELISILCG